MKIKRWAIFLTVSPILLFLILYTWMLLAEGSQLRGGLLLIPGFVLVGVVGFPFFLIGIYLFFKSAQVKQEQIRIIQNKPHTVASRPLPSSVLIGVGFFFVGLIYFWIVPNYFSTVEVRGNWIADGGIAPHIRAFWVYAFPVALIFKGLRKSRAPQNRNF